MNFGKIYPNRNEIRDQKGQILYRRNYIMNTYIIFKNRSKTKNLLFCQKFIVQTINTGNSNIRAFRIIQKLI